MQSSPRDRTRAVITGVMLGLGIWFGALPAYSGNEFKDRELAQLCIELAAHDGVKEQRAMRLYLKMARQRLGDIRYDLKHTHNKREINQLKKRQALLKQVVNVCEAMIGPCDFDDVMVEVVIENDSDVLVEFLIFGTHPTPQAVGAVYSATIGKATLPLYLLADPAEQNIVMLHPSFDGQPIDDPKVKKEVKRTFLTVYPRKQPCLSRVTLRITNRDFAPKTGIIVPPGGPELSTQNWAGTWSCDSLNTPWDANLNISGQGAASTISADFPTWTYAPAHEEYRLLSVTQSSASGTMILYDRHPPYLWSGNFSIGFQNDTLILTRHDDASGWTGIYNCTRA